MFFAAYKKIRFSFKTFMFVLKTYYNMADLSNNQPGVRTNSEKGSCVQIVLPVHSITIVRQLERVFEFDQDFFKYKLRDIYIQCHNTSSLYTRVLYNYTAQSNVQTFFIMPYLSTLCRYCPVSIILHVLPRDALQQHAKKGQLQQVHKLSLKNQ